MATTPSPTAFLAILYFPTSHLEWAWMFVARPLIPLPFFSFSKRSLQDIISISQAPSDPCYFAAFSWLAYQAPWSRSIFNHEQNHNSATFSKFIPHLISQPIHSLITSNPYFLDLLKSSYQHRAPDQVRTQPIIRANVERGPIAPA